MAPITIIPKACSCCKGERSSRDKSSNLPLPNILYEGSEGSEGGGGGSAASFIKKGRGWRRRLCRRVEEKGCGKGFLGWTGPMGRRVRKFDGLSGRGLWIALRAILIKSALRELTFCVIWHDTHSGDWLTAFTTKGGNCGMVHEIYDSLFFLSILLVSP